MKKSKVRREFTLTLIFVFLALVLVAAYYWEEWGSISGFVTAIDHCDILFCDFVYYFHTTGSTIFKATKPIPGYFYSAFLTLLFVPFAAASDSAAIWYWGGIQIVLSILLCVLPLKKFLRLTWRGTTLYVFLFITSFPLLHNFKWGQLSVLLTLCTVSSFHAYQQDRRFLAGFLLALGASIKYYPGIFVIYYLMRRDLRVLSFFLISLLILFVIVPALILGPSHWFSFQWESFATIPGSSLHAKNANSQYFAHVVLRFMHDGANRTVILIMKLLGYAVACANVGLIWLIQRSSIREKISLSVVALFLTLPFILYTSWPHYFVFLPFCQAVILKQLKSYTHSLRIKIIPLYVTSFASCAVSSVFVFNLFDHWSVYNRHGMLFIASILLLITLYGFVAMIQRGEAGEPRASKKDSIDRYLPYST